MHPIRRRRFTTRDIVGRRNLCSQSAAHSRPNRTRMIPATLPQVRPGHQSTVCVGWLVLVVICETPSGYRCVLLSRFPGWRGCAADPGLFSVAPCGAQPIVSFRRCQVSSPPSAPPASPATWSLRRACPSRCRGRTAAVKPRSGGSYPRRNRGLALLHAFVALHQ